MLAVEFSSSSDDELERELIAQRRRAEHDEQHIERATSAHAPLAPPTVTLPGGRLVEIRMGSVYIPVRNLYVHTIEAKRHPSWFFGDGSLRRHRRPPVLPECVLLYAVRGGQETLEPAAIPDARNSNRSSTVVSLRDASNTDFLVFKEVVQPFSQVSAAGDDTAGEETGAITSGHRGQRAGSNTCADRRRWSPPCFQRAAPPGNCGEKDMGEAFTATDTPSDSLLLRHRPTGTPFSSPADVPSLFASVTRQHRTTPPLSVATTQSWATGNRRLAVHAQHPFFTYHGSNEVFFYNGVSRAVGRFWCESEDDVLHTELVQQLGGVVPQKDLIGAAGLETDNIAGYTLVGRHFVTCALQASPDSLRGEPAPLHVFKGAAATGSAYECWCPYSHCALPSLAVSAQNDLFECAMRPDNGVWERRHLRRFVSTPPTALCAVGWHATSTGRAPSALLSGMRNGTVQITPLQGPSRRGGHGAAGGFFDATPRHASASVVAMHALPDREFEVVTVASTGEAKLWDVRCLSTTRDPVLSLSSPKADVGTVAGFCGHLVAIATRTASVLCVDALTGATLAEVQDDLPEAPDKCCVVRTGSEYQVYVLKEQRVHRVVLTPV